jgi:uncharacterized protein (DUF2249 family)
VPRPALDEPQPTAAAEQLSDALTRLLIQSLRLLRDSGSADPACQIAAEAWQVTNRTGHPAAQRFNGLLHYLTAPHREEGEIVMPDTDRVLDVRQEIPARRHELIFRTYAELEDGNGFVLVNDHDPKPLYYQFAAEHANQFEWDYLEQGPQVWRVRIGRPAA